jgi:hypothetical protein
MDSAAGGGVRRTGQVLLPLGEFLLQVCCKCSYDPSLVQFLIAASCLA